jgi:hypothetical protein
MFDLGNNANHASLKMTIPLDQVLVPLKNVDEIDGKIITQTQVLAKELAMPSECDDDEQDEENLASSGSKGNLSS